MSFYLRARADIFTWDYLRSHMGSSSTYIQDSNWKIFQVPISGDVRKEQVVLWHANKVWLLLVLNLVADWSWSLRSCKHQWSYCQNWDICSSSLLFKFYGVNKGQCHTVQPQEDFSSQHSPTQCSKKCNDLWNVYPFAKQLKLSMMSRKKLQGKEATGWAHTWRFDSLAQNCEHQAKCNLWSQATLWILPNSMLVFLY